MSARSSIEWTDATYTPIRARRQITTVIKSVGEQANYTHTTHLGWHCEHVSPGCEHCYAETMNKRLGTGLPFKPGHLWGDDGEGLCRGPGVRISGGVSVGTPDFPPEGYDDSYPELDWVIVGGESGPHARPMHPDWARSLRDQCQAAGVPFFFKQHGEWLSVCDDDGQISYGSHRVHTWGGPEVGGDGACYRVGKSRAGRLLDGIEHNGFPA